MSDIADIAQGRIENTIADGIAECRRKPSLLAAGACHFCGEPVAPGKLFCDVDCARDWEYEQARRKANGK